MLHAKFQNHRPSGSEEEDFLNIFAIYSHGGHLGHVTLTIHTNFHSLFLRMLHKKFGFDWPSGFSLGEKPGLYFWSSKCPLKSPPHARTSHWQNHHCFPPVACYLSFFSALFDYIKQTLQISSPHCHGKILV